MTNEELLKKASCRFHETFGELPADHGYPVLRVWQREVFFAQSKEDLDLYLKAEKVLFMTDLRTFPPFLILLVFLTIVLGATSNWEIAFISFAFCIFVQHEVVRRVRKRAKRQKNEHTNFMKYSLKDDCFYGVL